MRACAKERVTWALLCLAALFLMPCLQAFAEEQAPLEVYLIDPCGGCQGAAGPGCGECREEDAAWQRCQDLLKAAGQGDRGIRIHNLRRSPERYDELAARLKALGHEGFSLPVLTAGEAAFPGDGSADALILDYLLTGQAPEDLSLGRRAEASGQPGSRAGRRVIYMHSRYCEDCRQITPWLEEVLPGDVELISFDIGSQEGLRLVWAAEARHGLREGAFMVPALISGERLMLGSEAIREGLAAALADAALTPLEALLSGAE